MCVSCICIVCNVSVYFSVAFELSITVYRGWGSAGEGLVDVEIRQYLCYTQSFSNALIEPIPITISPIVYLSFSPAAKDKSKLVLRTNST